MVCLINIVYAGNLKILSKEFNIDIEGVVTVTPNVM